MNAERLNNLMLAVSLLGVLLLLGTFLRANVRLFQRIFLPSSLIAGFTGLVLGPQGLGLFPAGIMEIWAGLPGRLISVVFACMFLGHAIPSLRTVWREAGPQICYGFVAGFGQYFVAILVTMALLTPLFGVPPIFATILEIGFSGGHGTASGMCEVFGSLGFPDGCDLSLMSATVGITSSVVFGMLLVNVAARRGHALFIENPGAIPRDVLSGILDEKNRRPIGTSTVSMNAIEPLAFHLGFVGISILLGWLAYNGIRGLHPMLKSFPLFPLAMLGGIAVQAVSSTLKIDRLLDRQSFERIQGLALDILVVSAIASLNLRVVLNYAVPFGFKQIVYEPLLGGGLVTSISPILLAEMGLTGAFLALSGIIAVFLGIAAAAGFFHRHPGPYQSIHQ